MGVGGPLPPCWSEMSLASSISAEASAHPMGMVQLSPADPGDRGGGGAWDQQFLPTRQPLSYGKMSVRGGSTTCLSRPSRIPQGTTPPGAGDTPGPGPALQVRWYRRREGGACERPWGRAGRESVGAVPGSSCAVSFGRLPEGVLGVKPCPAVEPAAPVLR